jgi:hypothetical protein
MPTRQRSRPRARARSTQSTLHEFPGLDRLVRARFVRRCFLVILVAFIVLGVTGFFGVRTRTAQGSGGGYTVEVEYPQVTRPGLDSPWTATVRRPGGFAGPVTIAVTSEYFDMFDENGLDPDPAKASQDGEFTIWTFEPPSGDTLTVAFDALLSPAQQWGRGGVVQVREGDVPVVEVPFHTWVSP